MDVQGAIFRIPGSHGELLLERSEQGRLLRISGGGRVYYEATEDGRQVFDGGFVTMVQTELPGGMLRTVETGDLQRWTESYSWDEKGLLTEIDGVTMRYDDRQRVIACVDEAGTWNYGYAGPYLSVIDTPSKLRQIVRGEDGRPLAVRDAAGTIEIFYDEAGQRRDCGTRPSNRNFDASGRLWTVCDADGRVLLTYIWEHYHCLGCIAGDVGNPLGAVYSLDPTGTPVRVVTREGMRRIPRDAFGEGLLAERDVPGLFGGAVVDGMVHLPYRRLDPFSGSFDSPDPLHGEKSDPRRASGYAGPLAVELPASGPYTVCRNNPVTLADPTGAISDYWWFIPSALTWSLQNTIGSLLGMWLNLEFSPLGMIVSACVGANPFDIEGLSARNYDAFAIRSDGWLARVYPEEAGTFRTWTYQFLVNAPENNLTNLEDARLFAPEAAFRPRLYGTVLRCIPRNNSAFLLGGQRTPPNGSNLVNWSRLGGEAEPVIPGSLVPAFPSGGLHFGQVQRGVRGQTAEVVELEPSGNVLSGTISQRALITLPGTGLGLTPNSLVALTDSANVVEVARVLSADEENGRTLVRVDTSGGRLGSSGIRLEGLSALVGTENLTPVAGQTQRLSVTGSSNDYRPNVTVLRISHGATVGFAKVTGLEAQLTIDEALPASLGNSLRVRPTSTGPEFDARLLADERKFTVVNGTVPGAGTGVVVGSGANAIPAIVRTVSGPEVTVDRSLRPLGGDGTNLKWRTLSPLPAIGTRSDTPETERRITYAPDRAGAAPTTGHLWIEGAGIATRRIDALNYDAIVLGQPLPDALPDPYSVDRFTLQPPNVTSGSQTSAQILALNAPPPNSARAFHVIELNGAALAAGSQIANNVPLAGDTATIAAFANPAPVAIAAPAASGATQAGNTVTINTLAAHGFQVGDMVRLRSVDEGRYNGSRIVTAVPSPTSFQFDHPVTGLPSSGNGSASLNPIMPGQIVILQNGANLEAAVIKQLRLTATLSRTLPLGATGLEAVLLAPSGPTYNGVRRGDRTIRVRDIPVVSQIAAAPTGATQTASTVTITTVAPHGLQVNDGVVVTGVDVAGYNGAWIVNGVPSPTTFTYVSTVTGLAAGGGGSVYRNRDLPRFSVGDLVQVSWTLPTRGERLYRVQFVNGSTITGADDEAIIPNNVTAVTVRRLSVADSGTGSSRLGIDGQFTAPNQVRFNVWDAGAFNLGDNRLGIVDGQNVYAANLAAGAQPLDLVFLAAPGIAGPLTISFPLHAAPVTPFNPAPGFSTRFTLDGASLVFLDTPLTASLTGLILAVPYIETTRRVNGNLASGNVRIPNDHENEGIELDRRQALIDHELVHTQQSAKWGPLLFAYFPLWAVEMITELASSPGMPEFSRYVPATVAEGSIAIPASGGVAIGANDYVQVAQNRRVANIRLGAKDGDNYTLTPENRQLLSQRSIAAGAAQVRREESGGPEWAEWIVNIMQLMTVGGLMNQITVAGWGGVISAVTMFIQWIRGLARNSATAQLAADGKTLTLGADQRVEGAAANSQLAVQKGDKTYVRIIETVRDRTIVLTTTVPLEGEVRVSAYSTSSALFAHWHDYYPASFEDSNRPASIRVQPVGDRTLTLAVNDRVHIRRSSDNHAFNTVVTAVGAGGLIEVEQESLVPVGQTDEFFIAKIGEDDPMGFTDQFLLNQLHIGWMQYLHDPWGQIVYRARPTSTAGQIFARSARYLFGTQGWSVLPAFGYFFWDNAFQSATGQRSHMEQEASHRSGDTYCPIGTLHGEMTVVGDIARYWLTELGGQRDNDPPAHMIVLGRQDAPGANNQQYVAPTPNQGSQQAAGLFVPDAFYQFDATIAITGAAPRAWIPANTRLERSAGAYVAFTRPGTHSVTAQQIPGLPESQDAQNNGFDNIITHQRNVGDVTVTLATLPVAEAATIDLIPFQRAALSVAPDSHRVYRATLNEPGAIANIENNLELVMLGIAPAAAPAGLSTENIEVSRYYRYDAASRAYDGGLGPVALAADLDIAVRRFQIRLVDTIPMRGTADPTAAAVANVRPGDRGSILIPAPFAPASIATALTGTPSLTPQLTPLSPIPAAIQGFVRDGGVIDILFPADQPPEAQARLTLTIPVGPPGGATTVPVTCVVTVDPHFTLDSAGGFNLSAAAPLVLRAGDNTNISLVGTLNGITVAANNAEITLTATAATPRGPQVVTVVDTGNPQRMARRTINVVP